MTEAIMLFITGFASGVAAAYTVESMKRWRKKRDRLRYFSGMADPRTMEERHEQINWRPER